MALANREAIVDQQRMRLKRNTAVLDQVWHDCGDYFKGKSTGAGTLCLPRVVVVDGTLTFCEELIREAGIMVVPLRMFAYGDHYVRMDFGREDFPTVLLRFGEYLHNRFG